MHRLNLTIDEALYQQARVFSCIEKKSISDIIRDSLTQYLSQKTQLKQEGLLLETDDEQEILSIIEDDTFISNDDFKKKFNL